MRTMMTDKYWYTALNVAAHFHRDFVSEPPPKKVAEMMAVAIAMAGMQEVHNRPYYIQGVSDSEQSPDVRTVWSDSSGGESAPWGYQQDVEVVTYTKYSAGQSLAEFVAKTKLAPNAAYDDCTTILVDVQAGARLPTAEEWTAVLAETGKNNPVLVLGRIGDDMYRLAFVHPKVEGAIDYNPFVLLKKRGYTQVQKWSLGTKAIEIIDNDERHCPFEKFDVRCQ